MNKKILLTILILVVAGFGYWKLTHGSLAVYRDDVNKVEFSYPKAWNVGSSKGFVKVTADPAKPDDLNMLVKITPAQVFVDYFNLGDAGTKTTIGDKTMTIAHREEKVMDNSGKVVTFTHLYWKDAAGVGYMFEISPSQKDGMDSNLFELLKSFKNF